MEFNLCGSFGFGNVGDEAVPLAMAQMLKKKSDEHHFNIIGRFDRPAMDNVIGIGDRDLDLRNKIKGLPLIFSGGGIIENNYSCSLFKCEHLMHSRFSSQVVFYAISVEPYVKYHWNLKRKLKNHLAGDVIYVRDVLSGETLNALLPHQEIEVIGDSVLWLNYERGLGGYDVDSLPSDFIAVSLAPRWEGDDKWVQWMALQLSNLAKNLKVSIVFVPMSSEYDDDRPVHSKISRQMTDLGPNIEKYEITSVLRPNDICGIFEKAKLVISMRLHGCVMSFAQRTPFIGLVYHPKLYGFAKTVGWDKFVLPKKLPTKQSKGVYGYSVSDLQELYSIDFLEKSVKAMEYSDFSKLERLKQKQLSIMSRVLL